jgi:hypothetical protein
VIVVPLPMFWGPHLEMADLPKSLRKRCPIRQHVHVMTLPRSRNGVAYVTRTYLLPTSHAHICCLRHTHFYVANTSTPHHSIHASQRTSMFLVRHNLWPLSDSLQHSLHSSTPARAPAPAPTQECGCRGNIRWFCIATVSPRTVLQTRLEYDEPV